MKIVTIKEFEDDDLITSIINDIYTEDKVIINLHCSGGKDYLCDLLTREVNKNKDKIKVYGSHLLSNGFWFFLNIECEKEILMDCSILIHKGHCHENILNKNYTPRLNYFEKQFEKEKIILKRFLTKKELKNELKEIPYEWTDIEKGIADAKKMLSSVEDKKKALLAQLNEVNSKIERYGGSVKSKAQTSIAFSVNFPTKGSKPAKVMFVIKELGKFSTVYEVITRLSDYIPSIKKDGAVVKSEYRTIYGAILNKIKSNDLVRVMGVQDNLYRYGLSAWFDDTGNPKPEYL